MTLTQVPLSPDRAAWLRRIGEAEAALHAVAMRWLEPLPIPADLTLRQLQVLTLIRHTPGITGQDLATLVDVSTPTMSGIVERVVSKDWVVRDHDPADRRRLLLHLTPSAEQMLADLEEPTREAKDLVLGRLADDELADMARLMERMHAVAQEVEAERG